MTSSPHGLYVQGCTRATMHAAYKAKRLCEEKQNRKNTPQFRIVVLATRLREAGNR